MSPHAGSGGARGLRVLVVGGANTDIVGVSDVPVVSADSNPGHLHIGVGGVGHNVAANLARMGADVSFVTAFGGDANARLLVDECRAVGLDISRAVEVADAPGSVYLAIMDRSGDLVAAISDMRVLEALTPEALSGAVEGIGELDGVVIDANPSPATIRAVFELFGDVPVFADAVSVAKASRLSPFLTRVHTLKASAAEARALTGQSDLARAADTLVERGPRCAWVTAGPEGAFWARDGERGYASAPSGEVVNTTGAGDAFMAGVVYATLSGWSTGRTARFAVGAAAMTLASEHTVSPHMDAHAVAAAAERVRL